VRKEMSMDILPYFRTYQQVLNTATVEVCRDLFKLGLCRLHALPISEEVKQVALGHLVRLRKILDEIEAVYKEE
jgi:hypothetical protein